jgi:hypothetical protein
MSDLEQLSQYVRMSTFPHAIADVNSLPIFIPFGFADNVLYSSDEYACAGLYTEIHQAGVTSEGVVPRLPRKQCADIGLAPLGRAT